MRDDIDLCSFVFTFQMLLPACCVFHMRLHTSLFFCVIMVEKHLESQSIRHFSTKMSSFSYIYLGFDFRF